MYQPKYYLLGLLWAVVACTEPPSNAPTANEALVRRYFEYFNAHDWKSMAAMYADTAAFKDPSLGTGIVKQSRQQTIEKYTALQGIFPNLHDEVLAVYPSGKNHVIVEFVSSGTAADKSTFCSILTIENGLITKDFTYFDNFDEQAKK